MSGNLFFMVMEADGDELQPFDAGAPADAPTADTPSEDIAPPATDDAGGGGGDCAAVLAAVAAAVRGVYSGGCAIGL